VGDSIVSKARYLVSKESLGKESNASAHIAREEMIKDEALTEEFLACDVNIGLVKEMRVATFQKIIWKVLNAVTGHEYREYRSKHTGRLAKTSQDTTFRGGLKANSKEGGVKRKLELDKSLAAATCLEDKLDATPVK
jgi:hypothetical protein